jgi:hypothetical protein
MADRTLILEKFEPSPKVNAAHRVLQLEKHRSKGAVNEGGKEKNRKKIHCPKWRKNEAMSEISVKKPRNETDTEPKGHGLFKKRNLQEQGNNKSEGRCKIYSQNKTCL